MTSKYDSSKKIKSVVKIALGMLYRVIYHSPEKVYSISKTETLKWEDSKYVDKIWWISNSKKVHYLKKKWFSQPQMVQFEWMKFPAPANSDDILTAYYGKDYNTPQHIPSLHGSVIFDAEISYRDYLKAIGFDEVSGFGNQRF